MPSQEDRILSNNRKPKKNIFKLLTKIGLTFTVLFFILGIFSVLTKAPERSTQTLADMLNTKIIDDQQYSQPRYAQNTKQQNQDRNIYDTILNKENAYNQFIQDQLTDMTDAMTRAIDVENLQSFKQSPKPQANKRVLRSTRSIRDCIKPNSLIDDEVQECVNGTREKTW